MANTKSRGFASMDEQTKREIARRGGRAAHAKGTAHEFSTEEAREAGRKGGLAVSQNRAHMAAIGRKGGLESGGRNRGHGNPNEPESLPFDPPAGTFDKNVNM